MGRVEGSPGRHVPSRERQTPGSVRERVDLPVERRKLSDRYERPDAGTVRGDVWKKDHICRPNLKSVRD